jgi:T-complex protein 1 subunit theta
MCLSLNIFRLFHVLFISEKEDTALATVVIRGSTDNIMDDIERAIDDGVNTFKVMTKVANLH